MMSKLKKISFFAFIFSALLIFSFIIYFSGSIAQKTDQTDINKTIATNKIQISTNIMMKENEVEVPFVSPDVICPGVNLSKIIYIKNQGTDCYLRVCVPKKNTENNFSLSCEDIEGVDDSLWVKKTDEENDYFYFKQIFKENDPDIKFCDGFSIPSEWGNESAGITLNLNIKIEVIQAKNFTPDINSDNPWENQNIISADV